jgi:ABC-2 type transport system ATP-binding protein
VDTPIDTEVPLAIEVAGLKKSFGHVRALTDVTFSVRVGEVFGYLGPNGAGKTTTIRILLDLLRPDAGKVRVLGEDPRHAGPALRSRVGFLPGDVVLWPAMSAKELIQRMARMRRLKDHSFALELAGRFRLDINRHIGDLSHGNRQKVAIVLAFMHSPELVILDEPTTGLDPLMQREFYALVREWADVGRTVFVSSHVMGEVERLAHRVAIVRDGSIAAIDDVEDLKRRQPQQLLAWFDQPVAEGSFDGLVGIDCTSDQRGEYRFTINGPVAPLLARLAELGVENVETHQADLEQAFLEYYEQQEATL